MKKFKLGQRVKSPHFGDGVVVYKDSQTLVEFEREHPVLHDGMGHLREKRGLWYTEDGIAHYRGGSDTITPIGPYEGERVTHAEYGAGTIVETESGGGKGGLLVQFDKQNSELHDTHYGSSHGPYKDHTCWFFDTSDYGSEIKPITEPEPAPEPEVFRRGERVVTSEGKTGTFVGYDDNGVAVILVDAGVRGWIEKFEGEYPIFVYASRTSLKHENKQ